MAVGRGASSLRLPVTESESSMRPVSARQEDHTITHGTSQEHAPGSKIHSTQSSHSVLRRSVSKLFDKGKCARSFHITCAFKLMVLKLGKGYVVEKYQTSKTKRKASAEPQSSRATLLSPPAPPRKGTWQKVKFGWRQKDSLEEFAELAECLDEARDLFAMRPNETIDASRYGTWRRAFRHRAINENKTASKLQCFGIVTDTTSRVSHLSPSKWWDRSLSSLRAGGDLFPPLWEIDTFDTLAVEGLYRQERLPVHNKTLDNQYHRDLFSFDRPLWGIMLRNPETSVDDVRKVVRQKILDFNRPYVPESSEQPVPNERD